MKIKGLFTSCTLIVPLTISLVQAQSIDEKRFILIGGIEQWVTIKGNDLSNPIVLFLHGGPGSPFSPYAEAIFGDLEKDFVLVNWDQRGTARTFGRNAPKEVDEDYWSENPLTVEQMTSDGLEVSEYIREYFGKQKIILMGTSWGSVLGVEMALQRPGIFYAYVGHSQLVNPSEDFIKVYQRIYQLTHQKKDSGSIEVLKSLGTPPYHNAKKTGQLMRIIKKYESEKSIPAPERWWKVSKEYDNETDAQHRYDGDDYSFINYNGHTPLSIKAMNTSINLMENGWRFKIPVYLIQGKEDLLTPVDITTEYFKKIKAPEKDLLIVPGAAHGLNLRVTEMLKTILLKNIMPGVENKQIN